MRLCSIASGSSGNCLMAGSQHATLLVDAGISGKRTVNGAAFFDRDMSEIDGILITHEHADHISGLGVLSRKYSLPIYATPGTIAAIKASRNLGVIDPGLFHEICPDQDLVIKDMTIHPFRISHDAAQPVGFRFSAEGRSVAVATDMGHYDRYIVEQLSGLDGLLLEANHDLRMLEVGRYPYYLKRRIASDKGHLSNESAGQLLCRVLHPGLKKIFLGHLSQENNYEALAYETVCSEITLGDNPFRAGDFDISVARRDRESLLFEC